MNPYPRNTSAKDQKEDKKSSSFMSLRSHEVNKSLLKMIDAIKNGDMDKSALIGKRRVRARDLKDQIGKFIILGAPMCTQRIMNLQ